MNERVKTNVVRQGDRIIIQAWFDKCRLQDIIVCSGDARIALDIEKNVCYINEISNLEYSDGVSYP